MVDTLLLTILQSVNLNSYSIKQQSVVLRVMCKFSVLQEERKASNLAVYNNPCYGDDPQQGESSHGRAVFIYMTPGHSTEAASLPNCLG